MPVSVREALEEVAAAVAKLNEDHAAAVTEMAFERAAELRARAEALKERKTAILKEWPRAGHDFGPRVGQDGPH